MRQHTESRPVQTVCILVWRRYEQSLDQLTQAHLDQLYDALDALADMVLQFGYETTFRRGKALWDGGLSALESAFSALMCCGCKVNSNGTISGKRFVKDYLHMET